VDGDQRLELVLDHAGADGGEAFVESHGVFLGFLLRTIMVGTRRAGAGRQDENEIERKPAAPSTSNPVRPARIAEIGIRE
jgi:hypothetical protein